MPKVMSSQGARQGKKQGRASSFDGLIKARHGKAFLLKNSSVWKRTLLIISGGCWHRRASSNAARYNQKCLFPY
jgi:hypothetical protein